ncbi:hypothetical protein [Streptomyces qinzhouensis]|uniref:Uncharacterized protein n=1 Tax=Streptomyces qinzhouensis TaxID=2599401 RepID=A0A5B8JFJ2_9ACTN|nr:hypothetical protein [Streptomyces qinzhouensis]QDY78641.1 hypothetical protein FQU76_21390 [Streptomyces qinzhouensis]
MSLPDPNQQPGGVPGQQPLPGRSPVEGEPEYQWGPDTPPGTPAYGYPAAGYGYPGPTGYRPTQPGMPVPTGAAAGMVGGGTAGAGMPLVSIGDITVLHDTIMTPSGNMPLRGAVWNVTDLSRTEEKIPPYAIALAVVLSLFTCLLSLLFLLIKEKKTTGYIQTTVTGGGLHHATVVPAYNAHTFQHIMGQVNYARSISTL